MTTTNSATLLVARIFLAILFIVSGLGILAAPSGFAGYMGAIGLPFPTLVAWLVIALKVLGGLAILVGFQTRYAALAIAAFTIGSALLGHMNFADQNEMTAFMKNFCDRRRLPGPVRFRPRRLVAGCPPRQQPVRPRLISTRPPSRNAARIERSGPFFFVLSQLPRSS